MTTSLPQEVELKLALPSDRVDAFLARMARRRTQPGKHVLHTRYYDTPDFELGAAGIALRVRRAGRRWLQTLKTEGERQGGLSRRLEFEMAVARGALDWSRFPVEALAYVPAACRERLVPVFETRFERLAWTLSGRGGARIEVALDRGEVRAGEAGEPICEIELELKAGRPDALFDLAIVWATDFGCLPNDESKAARGARLARGAGPAPARADAPALDPAGSVEAAFAALCRDALAQIQANLPGALAGADPEYLHQTRVALRRLRATLRVFRPACVLPPELLDGLRALADALGPVRDWDVLCLETLPAIAPHAPDPAEWQAGMAVLAARREAAAVAMRTQVAMAPPGVWLLACQRWLLRRGWRDVPEAQRRLQLSPLADRARAALRKGDRPIRHAAKRFAVLPAEARHRLRIRIKRQRYALESLLACYPGRAHARYLATLRAMQNALGRVNDARVATELLMPGRAALGGMGMFALGWLASREAEPEVGENAKHLKNFVKSAIDW